MDEFVGMAKLVSAGGEIGGGHSQMFLHQATTELKDGLGRIVGFTIHFGLHRDGIRDHNRNFRVAVAQQASVIQVSC